MCWHSINTGAMQKTVQSFLTCYTPESTEVRNLRNFDSIVVSMVFLLLCTWVSSSAVFWCSLYYEHAESHFSLSNQCVSGWCVCVCVLIALSGVDHVLPL